MLNVTENAGAALHQMLTESEAADDVAVRFLVVDEKLEVRLDSERPGDSAFAHEERTVLIIDPELSELLVDKTLDVQQTAEGLQLSLS
ncbi:MAG: hypothetical protein O2807_11920 [bacterium]|nr:hypothetical protein [bacterium]